MTTEVEFSSSLSCPSDDALGLHAASRAGWIERVRYLIEVAKVDVIAIDAFDSSALYYAVYGGHGALVRLLLANGARADPGTFVGERCVYGALNDEIRGLLKEHNATDFSTKAKHPFARFLMDLARKVGDVRFLLGDGDYFSASKAVLGARSRTLRRRFSRQWRGKETIKIASKAAPSAMAAVLSYVATGRLVLNVSDVADAEKVAGTLELASITEFLLKCQRSGTIIFEDDVGALRESLEPLADYAGTPRHLRLSSSEDDAEFYDDICDLALECSDGIIFDVPSVFLRAQSDVVDAALETTIFREGTTRIFQIRDLSWEAAAAVIRWCVCGTCAGLLDLTLAVDVLRAAHRLLMPSDLIATAAGALADALIDDPETALAALPDADLAQDHGADIADH